MIMINMNAFPGDYPERRAAVRELLTPYLSPECGDHAYAIALHMPEAGAATELFAFQAPCVSTNAPANIRAVVAALRDAADQVEAAHADLLEEPAEDHDDVPTDVLLDMLGLVQAQVNEDQVSGWTLEQRRQAEHWATATHLAANDNDVQVPDQPDFIVVGDFREGEYVRNRQTGATIRVTPGGIWLSSFYERVRDIPRLEPCQHWPDGAPADTGCDYCPKEG